MKILTYLFLIGLLAAIAIIVVNRSHIGQLELQIKQTEHALAQAEEALREHKISSNNEIANLEKMLAYAQRNPNSPVPPTQNTNTNLTAGTNSTEQALASMQTDNLKQVVNQKYDVLFPELSISDADADKLKQLLIDRERVLNATTTTYFSDDLDADAAVARQQMLLDDIDRKIQTLLGREEFERYDLVKDSGFEQYQVRHMDNILASEDMLTAEQSRTLLFAKLKYKKEYSIAAERADRLAREGDKAAAMKIFESALETYKNSYLEEAQTVLTQIQFSELRVYEEQQFLQIMDSLRAVHEE